MFRFSLRIFRSWQLSALSSVWATEDTYGPDEACELPVRGPGTSGGPIPNRRWRNRPFPYWAAGDKRLQLALVVAEDGARQAFP